jgi:tripeptide aminopeptidase
VAVQRDFERFAIDADHPVVQMAGRAADRLGFRMDTARSGGGSDASVFTAHGIVTGVLGTGMTDVHSTGESIRLEDMARSAALLLETIRLYSEGEEFKRR